MVGCRAVGTTVPNHFRVAARERPLPPSGSGLSSVIQPAARLSTQGLRRACRSDVELCIPVPTWGLLPAAGRWDSPGTLGPVWASKSPTADGRHARCPGWDPSPVHTTAVVHSSTITAVPGRHRLARFEIATCDRPHSTTTATASTRQASAVRYPVAVRPYCMIMLTLRDWLYVHRPGRDTRG